MLTGIFNTVLYVIYKEYFTYLWYCFKLDKACFNSQQLCQDVVKTQIKVFCQQYTLHVTRTIIRSLKALEIVELQYLEDTGNRGHIEALKSKKATMNDLFYTLQKPK